MAAVTICSDFGAPKNKVSHPPSGTHRNSQSWVEKRGVREEIQATWWRKRKSPKGERAVKPVILFPSEKWVLKIGFLKVQNW